MLEMFSLDRYLEGVATLSAREQDDAVETEVLALFENSRGSLLRYALSFRLSLHDAEDIVQEAFFALFHHLRRGRSRSNLRGWIFRVTHNLALKRRLAGRIESNLDDHQASLVELLPDPARNPEEHLLFGELHVRLLAVFVALPERDRWCLQLRAEGLRYREIAGIVGISTGSVANSIAQSLGRLQRAEPR